MVSWILNTIRTGLQIWVFAILSSSMCFRAGVRLYFDIEWFACNELSSFELSSGFTYQSYRSRFNRQTSIQFLKPPLEDIFEQFHSCGNKSEVVNFLFFCSCIAWQSFCSSKNCVFRNRLNLWWPNSMYISVKLQVLIYHGNGCGPRPADCKFNPANSTSKYWKEHNIYMEDIHFQFWRFWYDLVGLPPPPQ